MNNDESGIKGDAASGLGGATAGGVTSLAAVTYGGSVAGLRKP